MHGLGFQAPHDHGAALDAASHGQYQHSQNLVHSLAEALSHRIDVARREITTTPLDYTAPHTLKMSDVSDLIDLKTRLCRREG